MHTHIHMQVYVKVARDTVYDLEVHNNSINQLMVHALYNHFISFFRIILMSLIYSHTSSPCMHMHTHIHMQVYVKVARDTVYDLEVHNNSINQLMVHALYNHFISFFRIILMSLIYSHCSHSLMTLQYYMERIPQSMQPALVSRNIIVCVGIDHIYPNTKI